MEFYYNPASPYCRSVMLLASALKLQPTMHLIDLKAGDHLKPSFIAVNPLHCVPTLVDNDLVLWESRTILIYLVDKYGRTNSRLYPKDCKVRAQVHQRLYFDLGTLCKRLEDFYYPIYFENAGEDLDKQAKLDEAVTILDRYLTDNCYAAGSNVTIADYALVTTVSSLEVLQYDLSRFPGVQRWYDECRALIADYHEICDEGIEQYREYFEAGN